MLDSLKAFQSRPTHCRELSAIEEERLAAMPYHWHVPETMELSHNPMAIGSRYSYYTTERETHENTAMQ